MNTTSNTINIKDNSTIIYITRPNNRSYSQLNRRFNLQVLTLYCVRKFTGNLTAKSSLIREIIPATPTLYNRSNNNNLARGVSTTLCSILTPPNCVLSLVIYQNFTCSWLKNL